MCRARLLVAVASFGYGSIWDEHGREEGICGCVLRNLEVEMVVHVGTGASLVCTLPRIFGRLSNFMLFVLKNEFLVESL
jgi:hypothetical protein